MPCYPLIETTKSGRKRRIGFYCEAEEPVLVRHNGRKYWFTWTGGCGWIHTTKDGDERSTRVPKAVCELVDKLPRGVA